MAPILRGHHGRHCIYYFVTHVHLKMNINFKIELTFAYLSNLHILYTCIRCDFDIKKVQSQICVLLFPKQNVCKIPQNMPFSSDTCYLTYGFNLLHVCSCLSLCISINASISNKFLLGFKFNLEI